MYPRFGCAKVFLSLLERLQHGSHVCEYTIWKILKIFFVQP